MEYCIIKNGVIENIIVCDDSETAKEFGAIPSYDGAQIGYEYDPNKNIYNELATCIRFGVDSTLV